MEIFDTTGAVDGSSDDGVESFDGAVGDSVPKVGEDVSD